MFNIKLRSCVANRCDDDKASNLRHRKVMKYRRSSSVAALKSTESGIDSDPISSRDDVLQSRHCTRQGCGRCCSSKTRRINYDVDRKQSITSACPLSIATCFIIIALVNHRRSLD